MKRKNIYWTFLFFLVVSFSLLVSCGLCQNSKDSIETEKNLPVNSDFGKTDISRYTPEIRENMKKLYHDKFGMFIHWGPYAQLEGIWKGKEVTAEWIMRRAFIPVKEYEKAAAGNFKPGKFIAADWVDIAKQAGMKFMIITAKHHDGFAMYNSSHPYNIVDFAGYGRDVLKELSAECEKKKMKLGFYYSQSQDWHEEGGAGNHWDFGSVIKSQDKFDTYFQEKAVMQVEELTRNYGDIFMIWFDTPVQMDDEKCTQMMDVVKKNQPGALVNSRLGNGYGHFDVSIDNGHTPSVSKVTWLEDLKIPWQTHKSVTQRGWGYTSYGAENDRSDEYSDFIYDLSRIVCYGGVYLLNVAPRPDGTIPESQVNTITAIGDWLKVNGESIYGADPSPLKFPPFAITSKPGRLYLHLKDLQNNQVYLKGILSKVKNVYCLADPEKTSLSFRQKKENLYISVPEDAVQPTVTVLVLEIKDQQVKVIDETIQQTKNGKIKLPVAQCEYLTRRISYDYKEKTTLHWGGKSSQILFWTVNVQNPGKFKVVSEDNGNNELGFELMTHNDTLLIHPLGNPGEMSLKSHGEIKINKKGIVRLSARPVQTIEWFNEFRLKGLELIPVEN